MSSQYSEAKQAEKLLLAQQYMSDYPQASKKQFMLATGIGSTYIKKWIDEGHLKFIKRSPRDNWKGY